MSNESIKQSVDNIDQILIKMSADHPGDILADIMHWCDKYGESFEDLARIARNYYQDERAEALLDPFH